ncbi:MAG: ribosomal-protein-alanine N-acetyltransferase [Hyphomicrobiales bacterium]|nr:MAG: ribosomal-protein-alanine N-acetyltransferase [Hyphomicrobiales bacterium]
MDFFKNIQVIEPAVDQDVAAIASLHVEGFERSWSEHDIRMLMRDDAIRVSVVRRRRMFGKNDILGFLIIRSVVDEAEILTISVRKNTRVSGLGTRLMEDAMRFLYGQRIKSLFLEVEESNGPAIGLYHKLGFKAVGERKAYYRKQNGESALALVMRRDLG